MSMRTIIELNHDCIARLLEEPDEFIMLLNKLRGSDVTAQLNMGQTPSFGSGIRVLAQRHHSDTLKLTVK